MRIRDRYARGAGLGFAFFFLSGNMLNGSRGSITSGAGHNVPSGEIANVELHRPNHRSWEAHASHHSASRPCVGIASTVSRRGARRGSQRGRRKEGKEESDGVDPASAWTDAVDPSSRRVYFYFIFFISFFFLSAFFYLNK